jgi:hypothetical protein
MAILSGRLRIGVLERDGYRCVYCGRTSATVALEVDHVVPRFLGGRDEATNLVTACFDCNSGKRARLVRLPDHVIPGELSPPRRVLAVASLTLGDFIEIEALRRLREQRRERLTAQEMSAIPGWDEWRRP